MLGRDDEVGGEQKFMGGSVRAICMDRGGFFRGVWSDTVVIIGIRRGFVSDDIGRKRMLTGLSITLGIGETADGWDSFFGVQTGV